jgi:hypothetical protein
MNNEKKHVMSLGKYILTSAVYFIGIPFLYILIALALTEIGIGYTSLLLLIPIIVYLAPVNIIFCKDIINGPIEIIDIAHVLLFYFLVSVVIAGIVFLIRSKSKKEPTRA